VLTLRVRRGLPSIVGLFARAGSASSRSSARWSGWRRSSDCSSPGSTSRPSCRTSRRCSSCRPRSAIRSPQQSAELQRERTLLALAAIYQALSRAQPVVFCIEDLHWSDPSTRELLERMAAEASAAGGLLLLTGRPEVWHERHLDGPHSTHIVLTRLSPGDARELATASLRGAALSEDVLEKVVARADGIPLFVEELAKSAVESRGLDLMGGRKDPQRDDAVPTTLQDSLNARLDRLSSAKLVAQIAATLGREFGFELIAAVADLDVSILAAGLAQLVEAEILYERGQPPHASYFFKHALLQDTAYQSQLRGQRRERHARAAEVIEERFASIAAAEPEALAHHCVEGGLPERAAAHFERAGRAAIERYANAEAVDCLRRGLAQMALLPEDPARQQLEITLRVGLGGPLAALFGYDAAEVAQNYARLRELVDLVGEGPQQLAACIGLINYYAQCSEFARLTEIGHAIVRIAEPLDIPVLFALGKLLVGLSRLTSSPREAIDSLRPAIALADQGALPPPTSVHEPDMAAWGYAMGAFAYTIVGDPGEGLRYLELATTRAEALAHVNTIANVRVMGCGMLFQLLDRARIAVLAREAVDLCADRGFRNLAPQAQVYHSWVQAAANRDGADACVAAVEAYEAGGSRSTLAWLHIIAADAMRVAGRHDEALARLVLTEQLIDRTGETGYLTWTIWLRGLLAIARGDGVQGERYLRDALELAHQRDDRIGALRCAISLADLLRTIDRGAEGRALVTTWLPHRSTPGRRSHPASPRGPRAARGVSAARASNTASPQPLCRMAVHRTAGRRGVRRSFRRAPPHPATLTRALRVAAAPVAAWRCTAPP
jgi:hypothetical protein